MIFNFDEADLKSSMTTSIQLLNKATKMFDFISLKEHEDDDLEHQISKLMP